ncbi:MAG TPA: hypothetical protein DCM17_09290 [Dehalococcoidia bacterium]|nr:hypothetical protein [Dehalococcoidia bacterium]
MPGPLPPRQAPSFAGFPGLDDVQLFRSRSVMGGSEIHSWKAITCVLITVRTALFRRCAHIRTNVLIWGEDRIQFDLPVSGIVELLDGLRFCFNVSRNHSAILVLSGN